MRKWLGVTSVEYDTDDPLGALVALVTLAPVYCVVAYTTSLCVRRDLQTAVMFAGQMLNFGFNFVLKRALDAPRPAGAPPSDDQGGMPSNHAQFVWFTAAFGCLFACRMSALRRPVREGMCLGLVGIAAAVAYSRVRLGYHTPDQVAVGAAVGAAAGAAWWGLYEAVLAAPLRALCCRPGAWLLVDVRDAREATALMRARHAKGA